MAKSHGTHMQRVMLCMIIIPFVFMVTRFACRAKYSSKFGWDDGVLAASWIFHAAYANVVIAATKFGMGTPIAELGHEEIVSSLRLLYIGNFLIIVAISASKTSFAMTLLGFVVKKWHIWLLWFSIGSVNLIMAVDAIMQFTQCTPVEKTWDPSLDGSCWDTHIVIGYTIFAGAWSALIDFVLAGVPCLLLWDVQMRRIEKAGFIIATSLGVFSGITACVKTALLPNLGRWTDLTYDTASLLIWAAAGTAIIIIAACIPFMRRLIRDILSMSRSSRWGHSDDLDTLQTPRRALRSTAKLRTRS